MKSKKVKSVRAWLVCARKGIGLVPMFPRPEGGINGFPTLYETKEYAVKQWDGWGFIADVIEVEIIPVPVKNRGK